MRGTLSVSFRLFIIHYWVLVLAIVLIEIIFRLEVNVR
nr:MAG TPA: hypothetical protein [Caudoviricetes sp.]